MAQSGAYIGFRGGLHLISEDEYLCELSKFGITKRQFRTHLRDLHVPKIQIGRTWFVERFSYLIALRYVCRVGGLDYLFPGSSERIRCRKANRLLQVDPAELRAQLSSLVEELLQAQKLSSVRLSAELRQAVEGAAQQYANVLDHIETTRAGRT